jgi:hypothetical protein
MFVRNIELTRSELGADRQRLQAEVVSDAGAFPAEIYWLDVPASHAAQLSLSGNSWLVLLAPLAIHVGEALRLPASVDLELLRNVHELMRVWHSWYPQLRPVPIEAETAGHRADTTAAATASMFSGGVDAWFTLLTNNGPSGVPGARPIDDLLCVWGFDVPLDRPDEYRAMHDTLTAAVDGLSASLVSIATNLHQTRWWRLADWGRVAHGCALASIAHALERRYSRLLIPSTHRYNDPIPWGSHPLTDHLMSSSTLQVIHDGAGFSRVEKTAYISDSPAAMGSLQVCWESNRFQNCGKCSKCYRTMATLYLLAKLDRCARFPADSFDPARLAYMFSVDDSDRAFMLEVLELALARQRQDIADSIKRSFPRSRRIAPLLRLARSMAHKPFVWRFSDPLERAVRGRLIV